MSANAALLHRDRIALVDANGNRNTFTYDVRNQRVERIDPLHNRTTFAYDGVGNQSLRIDARNNRTSYVYDEANQLRQRQYPDGSRATFAWDPVGNRTVMANETGRYTTTFDAVNRKQSVEAPNDKTVVYSWDAVGQRRAMIDPDGGRFTYVHDAAGRMSNLVNPWNERTTFAYDDDSRRTLKELANGARTSWIYDDANNIRVLANLKSDGTTLSSFDYDYDNVGNRTRVVETMVANSSRTTWTYDNAYQLLREHRTGSQPFDHQNVYDPAGNRTVKDIDGQRTTYAYDDANRLQTALDTTGITTFAFDADGNQLVETSPTGDRITNTWDFENRRTVVELPSGVRNTATYDPDGLRVYLADSTGHTNFIWDEQKVLTETDDINATQAVYTLEPLQYGRLISQRRASDSHWHLFNALGTTAQLLDDSQTVTDSYILDAWGVPINVTGSTINPYRYVGEYGYYFDPDTALYYVRARIYRPTIARWLSIDPLASRLPLRQKSHNVILRTFTPSLESLLQIRQCDFRYADNNPSTRIDPSGLATRLVCCQWARVCAKIFSLRTVLYVQDLGKTPHLCDIPTELEGSSSPIDRQKLNDAYKKCCWRNQPTRRSICCRPPFPAKVEPGCGVRMAPGSNCLKKFEEYIDDLDNNRPAYVSCLEMADACAGTAPNLTPEQRKELAKNMRRLCTLRQQFQ